MGVANSRDHHLYHPSQSPIKVVLKRRNEPLKKERLKWKNEHPMTEGQLRCKRAEFWDTAPAFDGRKEIWDALRAAAVAVELNDLEMAQAIVDGACITLPHENDLSKNAVVADIVRNVVATGATVTLSPQGKSCQVLLNKKLRSCPGTLTESYDELGNRYQLPAYTLTPPANLITERTNDSEAPEKKEPKKPPAFLKEEFQLRVRLSCGKDLRISASMSDTISQLKTVLEGQEDIEVAHQRWFFAGKLLTDKIRLQDTKIQKDFVVQVIVNNYLPVTKLMPN